MRSIQLASSVHLSAVDRGQRGCCSPPNCNNRCYGSLSLRYIGRQRVDCRLIVVVQLRCETLYGALWRENDRCWIRSRDVTPCPDVTWLHTSSRRRSNCFSTTSSTWLHFFRTNSRSSTADRVYSRRTIRSCCLRTTTIVCLGRMTRSRACHILKVILKGLSPWPYSQGHAFELTITLIKVSWSHLTHDLTLVKGILKVTLLPSSIKDQGHTEETLTLTSISRSRSDLDGSWPDDTESVSGPRHSVTTESDANRNSVTSSSLWSTNFVVVVVNWRVVVVVVVVVVNWRVVVNRLVVVVVDRRDVVRVRRRPVASVLSENWARQRRSLRHWLVNYKNIHKNFVLTNKQTNIQYTYDKA